MTDEDKKTNQESKPAEEKSLPKDQLSVTQHKIVMAGEEISYTVTAGTIVLKEEQEATGDNNEKKAEDIEKPKATLFFIAYTRDDVQDISRRPLTISFNGGPGSSSVWLHLGVLGPRRVLMDEIGNPLPPPYRLVDNEFSLLDRTDLVFIDPVSTGFSRAVPGEKPKQFHGFKKESDRWATSSAVRPLQALALAVPDRRELRHDAGRWIVGLPAGAARHVSEWDHADLIHPQLPNSAL
jgi:carboxypeptidase C (cathepsin A)